MKKILFLAFVLLVTTASVTAQKQSRFTIDVRYSGVIEGYDHQSKIKVFIDGTEVGESQVKHLTESNSYTVKVPRGEHKVQIVSYALYDGVWEAQNMANDYSYDMVYYKTINFGKKEKLKLHFNIDAETITEE